MAQKPGPIELGGVVSHVPQLMEDRGIMNANQLYRYMLKEGRRITLSTCYKYSKGIVPARTDAIENLARFFGVEMGEITSLSSESELIANA